MYNKNLKFFSKNRTFFESSCFGVKKLLNYGQMMNTSSGPVQTGRFERENLGGLYL